MIVVECIHGVEHPDRCCSICRHNPVEITEDATLIRTLTAVYLGHCDACGQAIEPGQRIGLWSDDSYRHQHCQP